MSHQSFDSLFRRIEKLEHSQLANKALVEFNVTILADSRITKS